jgi:hypothetical protein
MDTNQNHKTPQIKQQLKKRHLMEKYQVQVSTRRKPHNQRSEPENELKWWRRIK